MIHGAETRCRNCRSVRAGAGWLREPISAAPVPKPAPAKLEPPLDTNIGTATMLTDGTLIMTLRTTTDDGKTGQLVQKIPPTDMDYASDLKMVGPIKPGETKPINARRTS